MLRLCKISQRASREMAGYFLGYIFKGQPVGKQSLALVDKSLEYLQNVLSDIPEHKRFRPTAARTMVDFHHSTTTRPSTEEALLSMYVDEHDVTSAEFIGLYIKVDFHGPHTMYVYIYVYIRIHSYTYMYMYMVT